MLNRGTLPKAGRGDSVVVSTWHVCLTRWRFGRVAVKQWVTKFGGRMTAVSVVLTGEQRGAFARAPGRAGRQGGAEHPPRTTRIPTTRIPPTPIRIRPTALPQWQRSHRSTSSRPSNVSWSTRTGSTCSTTTA